MNFTAVLFDMDGVILDSEPLHFLAARSALKERGYSLTKAQYHRYFAGRTDREGFAQYCEAVGAPDFQDIMAKKAHEYANIASVAQLTACPGSLELIRWLVERNVPLAIVSGSLRGEVELVLETFGIAPHFAAVVTAEDVAASKPHPEGFLKAAAALGIKPAECVVIEDAPTGVSAAKAAGMRCIAVTTTYPAKALSGATAIVDRLDHSHLAQLG